MTEPMRIVNGVRQRGAALFTSLIMLIALTLVALASLGTSLLELRMSGNEEMAMSAFQSAQAGVDVVLNDALAEEPQVVLARGAKGDTTCYNVAGCTFPIPANLVPLPVKSAYSKITITQTDDRGTAPRSRRFATSTRLFSAAYFEVESVFDKSAIGQGKAGVVEGFLQLLPGSPTSDAPSAPQTSN